MKRLTTATLSLAFLMATGLAFAQDGTAPHGAAASQGVAVPQAGSPAMPGAPFQPPQDRSAPSPAVPEGTILVDVLDEHQRPVTDAKVTLETLFQSIAQGNSDQTVAAQVNGNGQAKFENLETALRYSYVIKVTRNGAHYEVPSFRLGKTGHRVIIHTYSTTHDEFEALVAASGMTQVSLREDFFRVDVMYRVINLSDKAWLPQGVKVDLPAQATAIDTQMRNGDTGFFEDGKQLKIEGTFPPGHSDIQYSFQLPKENKDSIAFDVAVPFHLLEYVVLAEEAPGMTLRVPGFDTPQSRPGEDGKKTLFVHRNLRRERVKLDRVTVELGGLPIIGPGRWIAALLALAIAAWGIVYAVVKKTGSTAHSQEESDKARGVLLEEISLLQKAFDQGDVGPRTYEQTRREILTALARLEPLKAAR
jgi:hypothetical protein